MYSVCIQAKEDVDSKLHDTLISTGTEPHDSKIHEELVIACNCDENWMENCAESEIRWIPMDDDIHIYIHIISYNPRDIG